MSILEYIMSFLAPHACIICGTEGSLLCPPCTTRLPLVVARCYRCTAPSGMYRTCGACVVESNLESVWPATLYGGPAKQLVHALKFGRASAAADAAARAMAGVLPPHTSWTVTHAPTVYGRARQRGYDQAQLIARQLARHSGLSYQPLLARQGVQRQLGQSRAVRRHQMGSAFRVVSADAVRGKDVLLVDDVLTTGSTLEAAAHTLHAAGARSVAAAVFAAA